MISLDLYMSCTIFKAVHHVFEHHVGLDVVWGSPNIVRRSYPWNMWIRATIVGMYNVLVNADISIDIWWVWNCEISLQCCCFWIFQSSSWLFSSTKFKYGATEMWKTVATQLLDIQHQKSRISSRANRPISSANSRMFWKPTNKEAEAWLHRESQKRMEII